MNRRYVVLASALALALLSMSALQGAGEPNCTPVPIAPADCVDDADCPAGDMCSGDGVCVAAAPTVQTAGAVFTAGDPVPFTFDPHGVAVELGGWDGIQPFAVEWLDPETGAWERLTVGMMMGCFPTDCVDGQAVVMCVDPAMAPCYEPDGPVEGTWDGRRWVTYERTCGADLIGFPEREPALPGHYRLGYRYGLDATPGETREWGPCESQTEMVWTEFELR